MRGEGGGSQDLTFFFSEREKGMGKAKFVKLKHYQLLKERMVQETLEREKRERQEGKGGKALRGQGGSGVGRAVGGRGDGRSRGGRAIVWVPYGMPPQAPPLSLPVQDPQMMPHVVPYLPPFPGTYDYPRGDPYRGKGGYNRGRGKTRGTSGPVGERHYPDPSQSRDLPPSPSLSLSPSSGAQQPQNPNYKFNDPLFPPLDNPQPDNTTRNPNNRSLLPSDLVVFPNSEISPRKTDPLPQLPFCRPPPPPPPTPTPPPPPASTFSLSTPRRPSHLFRGRRLPGRQLLGLWRELVVPGTNEGGRTHRRVCQL
jgi:hypothetical protein